MQMRDSWKMYFSVVLGGGLLAGLMSFLDQNGLLNLTVFGGLMLSITLLSWVYFRNIGAWVKYSMIFLFAASIFIITIGLSQ